MVSAFYTGFGAPHIAHADLTISHRAGIEDRYPEAAERDEHASVHEMRAAMWCQLRLPRRSHGTNITDGFEAVLN